MAPRHKQKSLEEREAEFEALVARKLRPGQVMTDVFSEEEIAAMRRALKLPE